MNIATAFVEIRPDTKKFESEVERSAASSAKSAGLIFAEVFSSVAFGAAMKKSIDAASDLNETVSKTTVVFGDAAGEIIDFANTAARSMGMSKRAYLDATSGLKGLLDNLGLASEESTRWSQDLTALGADLASFFNTDPADAIAAIGSALRGESEPIRAYNVNINEAAIKTKAFELGLYSGKGAIDDTAKAQATLTLITEQTRTAQGDFGRTIDGVANSQRIARAEAENAAASLGQNFLPIYQRIVTLVGQAATVFGALPGPIQTVVVALVGLVMLQGPIRGVISTIGALRTAIVDMSAANRTAALSMGALGLVAMGAFALRAKMAADAAGDVEQAISDLSAATDTEVLDAFRTFFFEELLAKRQSVADAFDKLTEGNIEGARRLRDLVAATKDFNVEGFDQEFILNALDGALNRYDTRTSQAASTAEDYGAKVDDATASLDDQAAQAEEAKEANDRLADAVEDTRTAFDDAADAADALRDAIDRVFGGAMDLETATRGVQAAADEMAASFKENGKTLDINTEAGRKNREAIQSQVESILDYGVAMVGAGRTTDEASEAVGFLTDGLRQQLRQAGLTEDQINDYLTTLGLTPDNVTTSIELANDDVAKERLKGLLDQLGEIDGPVAAEITALIEDGKFAEAEARLRALEVGRRVLVTVDMQPGRGLQLTGAQGSSRVFFSANGDYYPARPGGYMVNLAEAGESEVVLPLERPGRLAALLSDPRVAGPVGAAMGGQSGGAGGGGVSIGTMNVGSASDGDLIARAIDRAAWQWRVR